MARGTLFEVVAWVLAVACGLLLGYGDLHTDDTGVLVGLIALCGFLLGAVRPVHAWRWAVLLGLAILAAELYNYYAIAPRSGLRTPTAFAFLLAVVTGFALAGTYVGVWLRRSV